MMSSKNTAPLSPTVSKASSGALETMDNIYAVKNLPAVLRRAEEEGEWRILGTSLSGRVVKDLRDIGSGIPLFSYSATKGQVFAQTCYVHVLVVLFESKEVSTNFWTR